MCVRVVRVQPELNLHRVCVCVFDIHGNVIINFIYTHAQSKITHTHIETLIYTYTHTQNRVNITLAHVGGCRNTQKLITCHNDYILQRH